MNAAEWIAQLKLTPHPEGGYFRETYRSPEEIAPAHLPRRFSGSRSFSTAIYFLLQSHEMSALHRIRSDEIWHFHAGDTISVSVLHPDGRLDVLSIGPSPQRGDTLQGVVPAGCWFGARVRKPGQFALVGCTVAPGFDFRDFEMASRADLLKQFPQHSDTIMDLTHA